jgi:hypothetical protein
MMHIFFRRTVFIALCLTFCAVSFSVKAQKAGSSTRSGEQRSSEKGLRDNRYFIFYLNCTITNFGTPEDKDLFADIIRRDIVSQFFYMRFLFHESFQQIRQAQKDLIDLYTKNLVLETKSTRVLMNRYAPFIIHSKDNKAKHYLYLGYREINYSVQEATMADAYNERLYSMRLYKYVRAVKRLKEAKRYAFLARIQLDLTENEKIKEKILTYEEIKEKIIKFSKDNEREQLITMHADSYYRYVSQKSFFDTIWENPEIEKYPVFIDYKKNAY